MVKTNFKIEQDSITHGDLLISEGLVVMVDDNERSIHLDEFYGLVIAENDEFKFGTRAMFDLDGFTKFKGEITIKVD